MKKIFLALLAVTLAGCGNKAETLSGNLYKTNGEAGLKITLGFDKNGKAFHGQALNNYFGFFHAQNGKIKFSLSGSTMMAAPEPMMEAETAYFRFLDAVNSYQVDGNKLIISSPDKTMAFEKTDGDINNVE